MNKKLISKCCGDEVKMEIITDEIQQWFCVKCEKPCDTIPQPIQKEEVSIVKDKEHFEERFSNLEEISKEARELSTPSDTFIEETLNKVHICLEKSQNVAPDNMVYIHTGKVDDIIAKALISQADQIRAEVEKEWREKIEKRADLQEKEWQKTKKIEHLTARMELESLIIDY